MRENLHLLGNLMASSLGFQKMLFVEEADVAEGKVYDLLPN